MFQYILFDLDGTLTNSEEGITKCVQYALDACGIREPDRKKLIPFIGPPLVDSFQEIYGLDRDKAYYALEKYRERFKDVGLYENEVYEGITEVLADLKKSGKVLGIASSKPEVYVKKILEHFKLNHFFDAIVGSGLDGTRESKGEVVKEALDRLGLTEEDKEKVVLAGDRKHDVEGAHQNEISCVGVLYGFGGRAELQKAGADYIVEHPDDLLQVLI